MAPGKELWRLAAVRRTLDLRSSPPSASLGAAEPLNAQPERGGGCCKSPVRRRDRIRLNSCRDSEMKRVHCPERDSGEPDQEIASAQGVPIFQWMHLEKSLCYVVFKGLCGAALRAGIDVTVATTPAEKAM